MRRINKNKKVYFIGINRLNNQSIIATSKQAIADHLGICAKTISRHLDKLSMYETDDYIICKEVSIKVIRRGFAIKQPFRG